jgi:hypothetical protein
MGLWSRAWQWVKAADTTLSLLDMALRAIGASTVLGAVAAVIAWIVSNPYVALVVGMAVWIAVAVSLLVVMSYRAQSVASPNLGSADWPDDPSLPFPLPRPLPPDWSSKQTLFDLSFRLVDLITPEQIMSQSKIRDKTFYKCTIHGPAILMPGRETRFTGKSEVFDEPRPSQRESMWYEHEPLQASTWFTGVVGTERCVFRDCTFVDIGVMADPAQISKLKNHIAGGGDADIIGSISPL